MKLILGDCLEKMNDISDKSIDMILCDLPYGTTACKWDQVIPFEPLWNNYKRIIKDNGCIALFGSEPFSSHLRMSNLKMYKYDWIFHKTGASNFSSSKYNPLKYHEVISVFGRSPIKYYPQMINREGSGLKRALFGYSGNKNTIAGEATGLKIGKKDGCYAGELKYPSTVIKFNNKNPKDRGFHPTQKPVALLEYLIKTYTLENETVLDNCMGSGSTGVACKNLNRNFIGIEKDETYFNIAKERIESHVIQRELL